MARFWELLSKSSKENWPEIYQRLTGKKWAPPERDRRAIHCETKLESLEEIDKTMKEVPGYSIDVQGREG
ncbi:MAG: hypothetical protein MUO61_03375 [Dehalococcoidia bacterium]|nr:hypothetical protein [Dehalococcoidia bacterium]